MKEHHIKIEGPFFKRFEHGIFMRFDSVGSFYVSNNGKVLLEKNDSNISVEIIDNYLNSAVYGVQLLLNKKFVLHGSGISWKEKNIAFIGDSGMGKSTIVASMILKKAKLISDDFIILKDDGVHISLESTPAKGIRLWQESIDFFKLNHSNLEQLHPEFDKKKWLISENLKEKEVLLDAIIILEFGEKHAFYKLSEKEAFQHIMGHIRNRDMLLLEEQQRHFEIASKWAKQSHVYVLVRPKSLKKIDHTIHFLEKMLFDEID